MKTSSPQHPCSRLWRPWGLRTPGFSLGAALSVVLALGATAQPVPLSDLSFSEGGGLAVTNAGSLGGLGALAQQKGFPLFASSAPAGPFAPAGNGGSVDFGTISAGDDGGRAVDFPGAFGALNSFTVCGWVNCRDLAVGWGGNRIVFGLVAPGGSGFDLVHLADGSLQLGVNQWPDGSPAVSSAGRITADPNTSAANWVFLAVTYDGALASGQVNYYFGNAQTPAALDVTRDYNRGALPGAGPLTVGNFGAAVGARNDTGPSNSRCFRGLFDEIKVYPAALTLAQIQTAQTSAALPPAQLAFVSEPVDRALLAGQDATFTVAVTGGFPIQYQWQRNEANIDGATNASYTVSPATVPDSGSRFRVIVTNPVNTLTSSNATLYVNSDATPPAVVAVTPLSLTTLMVSFSETVDLGSAQEPSNYSLEGGSFNTFAAVLQPNLTNVLLTTDLMTTGAVYTLTVQYINDRAVPFANMMEPADWVFTAYMPPPLPTPIIELGFNEASGATVTNTGSAGGALTRSTPAPYWTNNVPAGVGGISSVDFQTTTGNYFVESPTNYPQLAGLTKFTIAGWVNNRNSTEGGGGNRLVTWIAGGGDGVDLVYHSDGSVQLGINQWPDGPPPRSSADKIPTDANAGADNWRFFAVTYDSTLPSAQVKFFFGSNTGEAALDVARDYARGPVGAGINRLCIGHFNIATRAGAQDRMLRGLIDEVKVFGDVLTPEQIVKVQRGGGTVAPVGFALEPVSQTVLEGQAASFSMIVTGTPPLLVQWQRNGQDIPGATAPSYSLPSVSMADNGAAFRVTASNAAGQAASSNAILTVIRDEVAPTVMAVTPARSARNLTNVTIRFSEPVNAGSAQEPGNYALNGGLTTYTAALQPDLVSVLLTIDPLTPGATHLITISGVTDLAGTPNVMTETNWTFTGPPALTPPVIATRFEEATGVSTTNSGALGGSAAFVQQAGFPAFSSQVPTGAFAPEKNTASVDFGAIGEADGGRSIALVGGTSGSQVGAMSAFTLAGWVNCRNLQEGPGGNRIVCAHDFNNDPGFDLVQLASGALRLGVNSWPDWPAATVGPFSSPGMITADANAGNANWVFFAVTYDGAAASDNVKFYFGSPSQAASLDVAATYPRGGFTSSGNFTLGNLTSADGARNATGGNSRVFRGLMDEVQVFDEALPLEQLQQVQLSSSAPKVAIARDGPEVVISWNSSARFQLQYRPEANRGDWTDEPAALTVNGTQKSVRLPANGQARFYRLISR